MAIVFIILGVWFLMALLMVCALIAAARRPACFNADEEPVPAVTQEKTNEELRVSRGANRRSSHMGDQGELSAT